MTPTLTLMPGLHGTDEMFSDLVDQLDGPVECVNYPREISQDYNTLYAWLEENLDWSIPRILIAESFSGPLALRLSKKHQDQVEGLILAASFCASPIHAGLALLPLRPLFMLSPPSPALKHFLIGQTPAPELLATLKQVAKELPSRIMSQRVRAVLTLEERDCPPLPNTPILLLQAQHDNLIPWEVQTMLEQRYPHATTHWMQTPHLLLQSAPEAAAKYIKRFLSARASLVTT
ncbi:hypothetical protein Rhal01_01291 [Rubritalea halochordaticola]|uniref:Serine aminopeptidase S33 domain-containing protein n=1 Tax=Rubritalea halochordaticola TaxID=714537 RepID=A0ABP9UXC7_9BACT